LAVFGASNWRKLAGKIHRWEQHLATVVCELEPIWAARNDASNALPHVFDDQVTGSIDTFPIEINRPPNDVQRLFYNGKYAKHVVKVRMPLRFSESSLVSERERFSSLLIAHNRFSSLPVSAIPAGAGGV